ncbi:MAG TPA: DEAD/DEAH box helicase, partial [Aquificae bacterium]|nr:DEAD/DEAH box helicase [Aquificota bacterium]
EQILKEFEEKFPYQETPDQKKAILEVYKDMDENYPMDRLLVGDVGFGKTEVAMRAAMKAVLKGKQVAIICPTTVLAEQHYRNFKERFKDFPVKIELLSRFVPRKKQQEIIENIKKGKVDIVIGTHRLLQKDIEFKNLGLLIIDEEHKFGVSAKEKLISKYPHIDTLYMSATPIPRTLYMGLSGFRDVSIIETPPKGRKGVKTYVFRYSDEKFLKAIEKEIKRKGQVFVVCNDIDSLPQIKELIEKNFPELKVETLHGQMKTSQIEKIMHDFLNKKIDVLVSTVIVESGLDIPNANTLIVLDAHKLGLSQLYQLRGRVGRSDKKGYVYLFIPKNEKLSVESLQRLEAIKDMPELGGGLKLALKDLEIRGAGTILGPKQSGFINKVGLDFYMDLLKEVLEEKEEKELTINIPIQAYIPDDYISDAKERIEIYTTLSQAKGEKELKEILKEIEKSYGKLPDPVLNTFKLMEIKNLAKRLKIKEISLTSGGYLIITPYKDTKINSDYIKSK